MAAEGGGRGGSGGGRRGGGGGRRGGDTICYREAVHAVPPRPLTVAMLEYLLSSAARSLAAPCGVMPRADGRSTSPGLTARRNDMICLVPMR